MQTNPQTGTQLGGFQLLALVAPETDPLALLSELHLDRQLTTSLPSPI